MFDLTKIEERQVRLQEKEKEKVVYYYAAPAHCSITETWDVKEVMEAYAVYMTNKANKTVNDEFNEWFGIEYDKVIINLPLAGWTKYYYVRNLCSQDVGLRPRFYLNCPKEVKEVAGTPEWHKAMRNKMFLIMWWYKGNESSGVSDYGDIKNIRSEVTKVPFETFIKFSKMDMLHLVHTAEADAIKVSKQVSVIRRNLPEIPDSSVTTDKPGVERLTALEDILQCY